MIISLDNYRVDLRCSGAKTLDRKICTDLFSNQKKSHCQPTQHFIKQIQKKLARFFSKSTIIFLFEYCDI